MKRLLLAVILLLAVVPGIYALAPVTRQAAHHARYNTYHTVHGVRLAQYGHFYRGIHHRHWYKWYWSHRYATYFYYDIGFRQYYYWHKPSGNYYPVSYFIISPSVPAKRPEKDLTGSIQDTDLPPPEPPQEAQPPSEKVTKPSPEDDLPDAKKEAEKEKQAEDTAGRKLNLARMVYLDGKRPIALDRLRDIIKDYPNTKAAQQAKEWLKEW